MLIYPTGHGSADWMNVSFNLPITFNSPIIVAGQVSMEFNHNTYISQLAFTGGYITGESTSIIIHVYLIIII